MPAWAGMTRLVILAALLVLALGALWYASLMRGVVDDLREDNAQMAQQIAQARVAEAIARDQLQTEQARTRALAGAIEEIRGGPDAPLPDHIRDLLRDLPDGL